VKKWKKWGSARSERRHSEILGIQIPDALSPREAFHLDPECPFVIYKYCLPGHSSQLVAAGG
jgi:hypothetical protein